MSETILIVDDEPGIRKMLGIALADKGYRVMTARGGAEALEMLKHEAPSIVLTDIRMPGMNGIELLKRIKAAHPDTEVVMITGHGDMELAIESLKADAADFITKPVDDRILAYALSRVCEKQRLRQALKAYTANLEDRAVRIHQRYRLLFNESPCYISVQNRHLTVVDANRHFKQEFNWQTGGKCYRIYKGRNGPCEECPVLKTFEDGSSHSSEMIVTSNAGDEIHLLIRTAPITGRGGGVDQVIEMSTDITQIRRLQDRLASLGLLIGSVSHGIKGLVTGLDGGLYLLRRGIDKNLAADIDEGMETVAMMGDRMKKLALDILFYARERKLNLDLVDVFALARDAEEVVRKKIKTGGGVSFKCRLDPMIGTCMMDAGIVLTALINLLENAFEAVRRDGSKQAHEILFEMYGKGEWVIFAIKDDGIGMDKDMLNRLFTLTLASGEVSGAGLGLFVANEIIRDHGGRIEVASEPERGSQFTVYLPLKEVVV
ncbi:MAG: response regulator [Desulfobacterales bacterium]